MAPCERDIDIKFDEFCKKNINADGFLKVSANGSSVVINIGDLDRLSSAAIANQSSITIPPQPFKLHVETSTDWAIVAVGVASIFSSLVIARFASRMQGNQIKSNIANMRQRWLEELRNTAVNFSERAVFIVNHLGDDNGYFKTAESNTPYSEMVSSGSRLQMMMDIKHKKNKRVEELVEEIIELVRNHASSEPPIKEFTNKMREFEGLIRDILEEAWSDIKNDLHTDKSDWFFWKRV